MTRNGTSLQVWFNKKTLYNKLCKQLNKEKDLMVHNNTVNKSFPSALDDTHKYGIGISSGTI